MIDYLPKSICFNIFKTYRLLFVVVVFMFDLGLHDFDF